MQAIHFGIRDRGPGIRLVIARLVAVVVLGVAGVAGSVVAQIPTAPATPPLDTLGLNVGTIRTGDVIRLTVFQTPELSGEFIVDARGIIEIPGIGPVRVFGLRVFELHDAVSRAIETVVQEPSFTTDVLLRVYVLGEVGNPGVHLVPPGTTLLSMLAIVGGETPLADLKQTVILRDQKRYFIDLEAGKEGGYQGRYNLFSDDYVTIPEKRGFTRETLGLILSGVGTALTLFNLIVSLTK